MDVFVFKVMVIENGMMGVIDFNVDVFVMSWRARLLSGIEATTVLFDDVMVCFGEIFDVLVIVEVNEMFVFLSFMC